MNPELSLLYTNSDRIGYGRLGVKLNEALTKLGVNVHTVHAGGHDMPPPTNVLGYVSLPTHTRRWYDGQYKFMYTMWETDKLPDIFTSLLYNFDLLIVPSEENRELYSQHHPNVHYVPLAIDSTDWAFLPRTPDRRYFRFLISGSGDRKGCDLAYKAFNAAFPYPGSMSRIPILMMKANRIMNYDGEYIENFVGKVSMEREIEIYSMADCYVQPSRGEGFGFQPLQAIAQGIPTILTDAHGHRAYSHLSPWKLSAVKAPVEYNMLGYADNQHWWEPDFDELVDAMRDVYEVAETVVTQQICREASSLAHMMFNWETTALNVKTLLAERVCIPYSGTGEIQEMEQPKYLIRVNRDYTLHAAGDTLVFEPGKDYYEIVDIKRVMYESDLLDPSCLSPDAESGLTDAQIAELPHYLSRNAFCPTCGTQYNTGIHKSQAFLNGNLTREDLKIE